MEDVETVGYMIERLKNRLSERGVRLANLAEKIIDLEGDVADLRKENECLKHWLSVKEIELIAADEKIRDCERNLNEWRLVHDIRVKELGEAKAEIDNLKKNRFNCLNNSPLGCPKLEKIFKEKCEIEEENKDFKEANKQLLEEVSRLGGVIRGHVKCLGKQVRCEAIEGILESFHCKDR